MVYGGVERAGHPLDMQDLSGQIWLAFGTGCKACGHHLGKCELWQCKLVPTPGSKGIQDSGPEKKRQDEHRGFWTDVGQPISEFRYDIAFSVNEISRGAASLTAARVQTVTTSRDT